jgi:type IV pilus assembly protein PilX
MPNRFHIPGRAPRRERGTVLIVTLMFLIVLTLLGLSTMRGTTLEERMAGNSRDYNTALQAAEAALRDAEADLKGTGTGGTPRTITVTSFPVALIGTATPSGCNTSGLCVIANEYVQLYNTASVDWSTSGASSTAYGSYTGAATTNAAWLNGLSAKPRYVLELMQFADGKNKDRVAGASGNVDYYYIRITAKGWGANSQTVVTLQEVFIIPLPT